jgi:hypothetical protein
MLSEISIGKILDYLCKNNCLSKQPDITALLYATDVKQFSTQSP